MQPREGQLLQRTPSAPTLVARKLVWWRVGAGVVERRRRMGAEGLPGGLAQGESGGGVGVE